MGGGKRPHPGETSSRKQVGASVAGLAQAAKKFRAIPRIPTFDAAQYDRWLRAQKYSKKVEGTNFIVCKTPIGSQYGMYIPTNESFSVDAFVDGLLSKSVSVGLLILLVDSTEDPLFFDALELDDWDVKVEVVSMPRFRQGDNDRNEKKKVLEDVTSRVHKIVTQFSSSQPRKAIALASRFGKRRPQVCLAALLHSRGKSKDTIVKSLRTACSEVVPEKELDEEGCFSVGASEQAEPTVVAAFSDMGAGSIESPDYVKARIRDVCGVEEPQELFSIPSVVDKKSVQSIKPNETLLSWVPAGRRNLLYINGMSACTIDMKGEIKLVKMTFPKVVDVQIKSYYTYTILDGYVVVDVDEKKRRIFRYLVEDIVAIDGEDGIGKKPLSKRLGVVQTLLEARKRAEKTRLFDPSNDTFRIRLKENFKAKYYTYFRDKFVGGLTHKVEGYLFQDPNMARERGSTGVKLMWTKKGDVDGEEPSLTESDLIRVVGNDDKGGSKAK
uniref:mRNA capping enzyme adenylation domain-containing protein n=1 Tax=Palpitomonas bilix TaxID=652834 RepID=A0A7S3G1Z5_9EUKA|mmetsp:Transcript_19217/g.49221  ORF Transcript_19217/g.49221 Transcript_19217/m.49221 type:complete len:497 (+) Transcript_19217:115-1605(+)